MLTRDQIKDSVNVNTLLNTVTDFLRFVTEFFEVISRSGPHTYHSALQLSPQSSIIRKLYGQHISSPVSRILTGIPTSWDSCTASTGATTKVFHAIWSPCGQFIAVCLEGWVEVRDSTTLERVSDLKPPTNLGRVTSESLAFSPDGHLLACAYDPVRKPNLSVVTLHIFVHTHFHI